jgi:hypothetical protein
MTTRKAVQAMPYPSACSAFIAGLVLAAQATAGIVTFEDLPLRDVIHYGVCLFTEGVGIPIRAYQSPDGQWTTDGTATVVDGPFSGQALSTGSVNLEFLFWSSLTDLTLDYKYSGGNVNLQVNGVLANVSDFTQLNGGTLGGVNITVNDDGGYPPASVGELILSGPITSFIIGGQELELDNVIYTVPEPAPLSALFAALLALRRR